MGMAPSFPAIILFSIIGLGFGISDSQNVIFEDNLTDSQNPPGQGIRDTQGDPA